MPDLDDAKTEALAVLRATLTAKDAKPQDKVRAAEALLRWQADKGPGAALTDLDDDELLAIARGVGQGGVPPVEGPKPASAAAVPSDADRDPSKRLGTPNSALSGPDYSVPRETTSPMLNRDPAPPKKETAARELSEAIQKRTKKGPEKAAPVASPAEIGHHPRPWE